MPSMIIDLEQALMLLQRQAYFLLLAIGIFTVSLFIFCPKDSMVLIRHIYGIWQWQWYLYLNVLYYKWLSTCH